MEREVLKKRKEKNPEAETTQSRRGRKRGYTKRKTESVRSPKKKNIKRERLSLVVFKVYSSHLGNLKMPGRPLSAGKSEDPEQLRPRPRLAPTVRGVPARAFSDSQVAGSGLREFAPVHSNMQAKNHGEKSWLGRVGLGKKGNLQEDAGPHAVTLA